MLVVKLSLWAAGSDDVKNKIEAYREKPQYNYRERPIGKNNHNEI